METTELKELKKELQGAKDRLSQIGIETENFKQRLEAAKKKDAQVDSQIAELREERQWKIVAGGDAALVTDVTAKIKEIMEYDDLVEDEIAGLTSMLSGLEKEEQRLTATVEDLDKKIFREEIVRPLVNKYNSRAAQLAETLVQIHQTVRSYTRTFPSLGANLFFSYPNASGFGISLLPGMWMRDEQPLSEHFNVSVVAEKLSAKEREEDLKGKYPACECFLCARYTHVCQEMKVRCDRLGGAVPEAILLGQTKQRHSPETERCAFTPREK